jgi:hypothetical protein
MLLKLIAMGDGLLDRVRSTEPSLRPKYTALDWILTLLCGGLAASLAAWAASQLGNVLYTEGSFNIWFQGDNPRALANLLDETSNQYRSTVHPILPILTTPWVSLLPGFGLPPLAVAKAVVFACGAASAGLMFATLRLSGVPRGPSLLFTLVFMISAAFLHWYSGVEIAPFNGLSMCLVLWVLARGDTRRAWWWIVASALTLGVTISNWTAGLAAVVARWPLRRAIEISLIALISVTALTTLQRLVYPTAGVFFSPTGLVREREFASIKSPAWSPLANLRSAVVYSAVAPPPTLDGPPGSRTVNNQHSPPRSADWLGLSGMAAWLALLACGAYGAATSVAVRPIAFGVALMLVGQLGVTIVYGEITFLYAASIIPVLVALAGLSWFSPARYVAVVLAAAVVILGFANNLRQFEHAVRLASSVIDEGGNEIWSRYPAGRYIVPVPQPNRGSE